MDGRKLILLEEVNYTLREALIDSDGDTVWEITDPSTKNTFIVHTTSKGHMYISFFKKDHITAKCANKSIRKICEILIERGLRPTINIYHTNTALIVTCTKIGFRKVSKVRHLYFFNG